MTREKLSVRIERRLAACKICGGKGCYRSPLTAHWLACVRCADWVDALEVVRLLENLAEITLDCEPWVSDKSKEAVAWARRKTGIVGSTDKEAPK